MKATILALRFAPSMGETVEMDSNPHNSATSRTIPPNDWNPVREAINRQKARTDALYRSSEFVGRCATHGNCLFDTETGACLSCLATPTDLPVRLRYQNAYAISYPMQCVVHGEAQHDMATNRCLQCFTLRGSVRKRAVDTERLEARYSSRTTYLATCPTHGRVPHHTVRGKCLSCYNSLGYPRVNPSP